MQSNNTSEHARQRIRARAISMPIVDLVLKHGTCERSHGGSRIFYLPLRKIDDLGISIPPKIRDKLARCPYVVISEDNNIITTSYRDKRIWHKPKWHRSNPRRV